MLGEGQEEEKYEFDVGNTYTSSRFSQTERFSIKQVFTWVHEQESQVAQICATMDVLGIYIYIYVYHIRRDGSKPCYSDSHNMV